MKESKMFRAARAILASAKENLKNNAYKAWKEAIDAALAYNTMCLQDGVEVSMKVASEALDDLAVQDSVWLFSQDKFPDDKSNWYIDLFNCEYSNYKKIYETAGRKFQTNDGILYINSRTYLERQIAKNIGLL